MRSVMAPLVLNSSRVVAWCHGIQLNDTEPNSLKCVIAHSLNVVGPVAYKSASQLVSIPDPQRSVANIIKLF